MTEQTSTDQISTDQTDTDQTDTDQTDTDQTGTDQTGTDQTNSGQSAPPPTVWPTLRARDARGLIAFLVEAFGFEPTAVFGDGDHVDHAQLSWPPGGGVMLGSARDPGPDEERPVQPGTGGYYAVTDDVDGLYRRAVAAGAKVAYPLRDTDYGSRECGFVDPEGGRWSFGTYRGEPRQPATGG